MSKKRRQQQVEDVDPESDNPNDGEAAAPPAIPEMADEVERQSVEQILQLLSDQRLLSGSVRVYRKAPLETEFSHVASIPISEFNESTGIEETIADLYGGGRFRLTFCQADGRFVMNKFISIDPRRKGKLDQKAPEGSDATGLAIIEAVKKVLPGPGDQKNDTLLAMMKMQTDASNQFMAAMQQSNATMITAITSMVAALKPAPPAPPEKPFDMLTALKVFDSLKGDRSSPADTLKVLEFAHKLVMERKEEADDDGDGWLAQLARGLAPFIFGQALTPPMPAGAVWQRPNPPTEQPAGTPSAIPENVHPMPTAEEPGRAVNPAPQKPEATTNPPQQTQSMTPENEMKKLGAQILPMLIYKAAQGADPSDVADLANNPVLVSDEQFDTLVEILKKENWCVDLFGATGAALMLAQKDWFEEVRQAILKLAEEEEDEDGDGGEPAQAT